MSLGGFDYDRHAAAYPAQRRADPRIGARILAALGGARTVLNVGAGAGSYEPRDRHVIAVEPSAGMRAQRPRSLAPAIAAKAEALPLDDRAVDAAIAIVTIHHWDDPAAGLAEMRRVTRGPVCVLTFDLDALARFSMRLPRISLQARGTSGTASCAPSRSVTALCVSSSRAALRAILRGV